MFPDEIKGLRYMGFFYCQIGKDGVENTPGSTIEGSVNLHRPIMQGTESGRVDSVN
jgi:hypothetical protein